MGREGERERHDSRGTGGDGDLRGLRPALFLRGSKAEAEGSRVKRDADALKGKTSLLSSDIRRYSITRIVWLFQDSPYIKMHFK